MEVLGTHRWRLCFLLPVLLWVLLAHTGVSWEWEGDDLHPERASGGHRPWGRWEPMAGPPGHRRHG